MIRTVRRLTVSLAVATGLIAVTAGPAAAGIAANHCEPLSSFPTVR